MTADGAAVDTERRIVVRPGHRHAQDGTGRPGVGSGDGAVAHAGRARVEHELGVDEARDVGAVVEGGAEAAIDLGLPAGSRRDGPVPP